MGEHPEAWKTLGGHSGCLGAPYTRPAATLQWQADSPLSFVPYDMYVRFGARGDCGVEISSKEAKIIHFGAGMLSQRELWSACRSVGGCSQQACLLVCACFFLLHSTLLPGGLKAHHSKLCFYGL